MKKNILTIILKLIIVSVLLFLVVAILKISDNYKKSEISNQTNLIINNNNVTAKLKNKVIIQDDVIYISINDMKNFFDKYIYVDEENSQIITTYNKNIGNLILESENIFVNNKMKKINAKVEKKEQENGNESYYLPISELKDIYDIELNYVANNDVVIIDSIEKEQKQAKISKKSNIKWKKQILSKTLEKVELNENVVVISNDENGWTKVRTKNGKIGYIETKNLSDVQTVREAEKEENLINGKIDMFWDYFSEVAKAPNREGQKIDGVNVVSPSFFYIDKNGEFKENVGDAGKKYVDWAHNNGYKVWPMVSNSGSGMIEVTSGILNNYSLRHALIQKIVNVCKEYNLDGINIDFENMYSTDKDVYSRFIIELVPLMKQQNLVTSVDVTAPDGSETWSLCFDRTVLGDVADYLIFMAYDQYGSGSSKAGPTAGYNWVENNLNKFIKTSEVKSEKLILGIPFYTRIWTITTDGQVSSKVVNMKDVNSVLPNNADKTWNDTLKLNYVEYTEGKTTKRIWIEDIESIREKVKLVKKYNLAGTSAWEKDREPEETWNVIKEELNK